MNGEQQSSIVCHESVFTFCPVDQNKAKKEQGKNSLQHPDAPSATSYRFSGALLVDLFSKEQTLRCLYNLRISTN